MKKMMMILAALSAVTMAHAAAIKWTSGSFYKPGVDPAEQVETDQVWGYLFLIDEATYSAFTTPEAVYAKFDTKTKTLNGIAATKQMGSFSGGIQLKSGKKGDNANHAAGQTYYAAVVFEFFSGAVGDDYGKPLTGNGAPVATHWIANTASQFLGGTADMTVSNLANAWHGGDGEAFGDNTTGALGGWTPVPEPMCAALLAFGAVALGLRRKRS